MSHPGSARFLPNRRSVLVSGAALTGLAATGLGLKPARAQARGGHIRVAKAHGSTSDTMNPATSENGFQVATNYGIHGFLTDFARDGSIAPNVAARATPESSTTPRPLPPSDSMRSVIAFSSRA